MKHKDIKICFFILLFGNIMLYNKSIDVPILAKNNLMITAQKIKFPLRISSVNVTKAAVPVQWTLLHIAPILVKCYTTKLETFFHLSSSIKLYITWIPRSDFCKPSGRLLVV